MTEFRRGVPLSKAQKNKLRYSKFVSRIDIDAFEDGIGFVPLERDGANDIGQCPDYWGMHKHGDTTGKFAIHREKKVYNCWVCGGGSLLSLVMEMKNLDVPEATEWIYQFAEQGPISDDSFRNEFTQKLTPVVEEKPPLPWFNPNVLARFDQRHEYFDQKRIDEDTRQRFRAGYDPKSVRRSKKDDVEDYIGPSIIIPHFWGGRLVGWQQRWVDDDRPKWVRKWTNTFDFPKDETIFNYDRVLQGWDETIVVEAAATAMYLDGQNLPAVATFGSNVTENQMKLLRRFQGGVWLAPDYDGGGAEWIESLSSYLDHYVPVFEVPPVTIEESADLCDLPPDELTAHLNRAKPPLLKAYLR